MRPAVAAFVVLAAVLAASEPFSNTPVEWTTRSVLLDTPSLSDSVFTLPSPHAHTEKRQNWGLSQPAAPGVLAMQMAVVSPTQLLLIDRVQNNTLEVDGHSAWAAIYSLTSNTVRPVRLESNSFCAGGAYLSNGTLVNVGGYKAQIEDIPDTNGFQGLRYFNPSSCPDNANGGPCAFYESTSRIRLAKPRWYPSILRLQDGSLMVIGGSKSAAFKNKADINEATIEYWPPKAIAGYNGLPIPMQWLKDTLNANLFPIAFIVPGGKIFIAANTKAILYDWKTNKITNLPGLPNGVRVTYPMTGTGVLLPLSSANGYVPTVLICGGSTYSDAVASASMSSQTLASAQCSRLELSAAGIKKGWAVEYMPEARIMPDSVILPDGRILIINGGRRGFAGYGNVGDKIDMSNADDAVLRGVIYDPTKPAGSPSQLLTPNGQIAIAGSNPNEGSVFSGVKYPTEYRLELLSPPWMNQTRPTMSVPVKANYNTTMTVPATVPAGTKNIRVALLDHGFATHSVHMDMRHVWLDAKLSGSGKNVTFTMPPYATVYPPGPGYVYLLADGVPSKGVKMLVGTGAGPPVDQAALKNMLAKTDNPKP
ncbi:glyoxal oxidase N-terminus-domain-containing protein [Auriculariales sp. MPI-PUGE-AT-0066]|nr:glyoxal oxidase N-terminus-domain-containing protein [Auriculariales sp. MPI-PUGE-AT-0066]